MTKHPSSKDDLELGHHVVYYTFWPVLIGLFAIVPLAPVLWYFDYITYWVALVLPYISVLGLCAYFGTLTRYVIPSETYRKLRSGEWGEP